MIIAILSVDVGEELSVDIITSFDLTEEQFQYEHDDNFECYVTYINSLLPTGNCIDGSVEVQRILENYDGEHIVLAYRD